MKHNLIVIIISSIAFVLLFSCYSNILLDCEDDFKECKRDCDELYPGDTSNYYVACMENYSIENDNCISPKEDNEQEE